MPNVNRQTIYQMGNVVNDVVKQATGRDIVKAISMDFVTVEQNKLLGIETQSGAEVTFVTPKSVPLLSLIADIKAKQDLHGYDYPWPAGGGKNLNPGAQYDSTIFTHQSDGTVIVNGTADGTKNYYFYSNTVSKENAIHLPAGTYCASFDVLTGSIENASGGFGFFYWEGDSDERQASQAIIGSGNTPSKTFASDAYIIPLIYFTTGTVLENTKLGFQLQKGSSPSAYEPYSNICPITGYTGCNISVAGGSLPTQIYPVEWETTAGTVYGGTLDALTGKLTVTMVGVNLASLTWEDVASHDYFRASVSDVANVANNVIPNMICSAYRTAKFIDVYNHTVDYACAVHTSSKVIYVRDTRYASASDFSTAMTSANVILAYELAEPVEYELVELSVSTRAGENTVSADTGDITLSYYVYHDLI